MVGPAGRATAPSAPRRCSRSVVDRQRARSPQSRSRRLSVDLTKTPARAAPIWLSLRRRRGALGCAHRTAGSGGEAEAALTSPGRVRRQRLPMQAGSARGARSWERAPARRPRLVSRAGDRNRGKGITLPGSAGRALRSRGSRSESSDKVADAISEVAGAMSAFRVI
jgi:hypothetical protein